MPVIPNCTLKGLETLSPGGILEVDDVRRLRRVAMRWGPVRWPSNTESRAKKAPLSAGDDRLMSWYPHNESLVSTYHVFGFPDAIS